MEAYKKQKSIPFVKKLFSQMKKRRLIFDVSDNVSSPYVVNDEGSVADSSNDWKSNKANIRIAMENASEQGPSNDNSVADSKNDPTSNKADGRIAMENASEQGPSNDVSFSIALRTATEMQVVGKMNVEVAKTNNISVQDNTDMNPTNDGRW